MASPRSPKLRLSDFPTEIIENLLFFLPAETIQQSVLQLDDLRPYIYNKYFSEEIELHLDPQNGSRWFGVSSLEDSFKVNQIGGIERIEKFLTNFPTLVPHKYVIIPGTENILSSDFLEEFRDILSQAPQLEVKLKSPDAGSIRPPTSVPDDLIDLIYSFPNLYSVEIPATEFLPGTFSPPVTLKKFKLDGLSILEWRGVSLPRNLTHLDLSMTYSYQGMGSGANVTNKVVAQLLGTHLPPRSPGRLDSLVSLCLSNCNVSDFDLSLFPPTLEHLECSGNGFFKIGGNLGYTWPKGLKSLSLAHNEINDVGLKKLNDLGWPCRLEELDLGGNSFEELENITNLPNTLKTLKITDNQLFTLDGLRGLPSSLEVLNLTNSHFLETLEVDHAPGEYPYFRFPDSLRKLTVSFCQELSWNLNSGDTVPVSQRLHFPKSLEFLDLSGANLTSLACFVFPESLKTLDLLINDIQDLTSYNSEAASGPRVNWDQLTGLSELQLESNDLTTLKGWVPPSSLSKFRLSNKNSRIIETKAVPLFSQSFHESTDNLREVFIHGIDLDVSHSDFYLPQNLSTFGLSSCSSVNLDSFPALSKHEKLKELGLSRNGIKDIRVSQLPPNLKHLMLSSNLISELSSLNSLASHEHLEILNLADNMIQRIDSSWELPPKLRSLDLSGNALSAFEFTNSFASHKNLNHLDLSGNRIQKISLSHPEREYSSPLKFLNLLYLPLGEQGSTSGGDLYRLLERMGVDVIMVHRRISREHRFA